MQFAQPNAKVFFASSTLEMKSYIPIFHRWIQQQALDQLLIDVHNYSHVAEGPGIILVAHESYHCIDRAQGKDGLWYRTRRGGLVDPAEGLQEAAKRALTAAALLQEHSDGEVQIACNRIQLGFEDRLRLPNTASSLASLNGAILQLGERLFGAPVTVSQTVDERACFSVLVTGAEEVPLNVLLGRV